MERNTIRKEIEEIIRKRKWTLNTRIDYKENFNPKDQLKIICKCGNKQTLLVKSLKAFICPICKNKHTPTKDKKKICTLCEKPHSYRTQLCPKCNKQSKDLKTSIVKLLTIKNHYNVKDVFKLIEEKPYLLNSRVSHKEGLFLKRNIRENYNSDKYRKEGYKKWESEIPPYILNEMLKYPQRELLTLSGDKFNPNIHYICKGCNEEQVSKFEDIQKGHGCLSNKSTGEIIVEDFLKSQSIAFVTQFNTLNCINPITKRQLPYDIELIHKRILIEIQGDQHLKFTEYFHGTMENFEYQKRKDDYKKRWAEKQGYKLIYIYYNEFTNEIYKEKILNAINFK